MDRSRGRKVFLLLVMIVVDQRVPRRTVLGFTLHLVVQVDEGLDLRDVPRTVEVLKAQPQ